MSEVIKAGGLVCNLFRGRDKRICYLLVPMPVDEKIFEDLVSRYGATWVVVSGMDWDNDLTPWPAVNVPDWEPPFKGLAPEFLQCIENEVIPTVEEDAVYQRRILCGISLSGLFALWAWMESSLFTDIGSISGSFWYPGFLSWLKTSATAKPGRACFSLGEKEGGPNVPAEFSNIRQETEKGIKILESKGIKCTFDLVPGTHYAPIAPRLRLLVSRLLTKN